MSDSHEEVTRTIMDAFFQFRRLHRHHKSPIMGMKHNEVMVLFRVKEHGGTNGARVSDISHRMRVTSPTVTQLLSKLEEDNLIERTLDPDDRRSMRITLTAKGETIIQKAEHAFFARYSSLVDALGTEKSVLLTDLLFESIKHFREN
ncbi:MAG: MarR family transcriptional regulator [Firmicutes bacterium]|nr:MarR family transcriptional regulator [Bacillota bacterium]